MNDTPCKEIDSNASTTACYCGAGNANLSVSTETTCALANNPVQVCEAGVVAASKTCYCGEDKAEAGDHCSAKTFDAELTKKCASANCAVSGDNCNV